MIFYSHWLDLVGKLFSFVLFMTLLMLTRALDSIFAALEETPNPEFFGITAMGVILVGFYFAFHRPIVDVFVTKLYVRLRFGVSTSWEQAKLLRRLFCLSLRTGQWHPMTHVRSLPVEQRLSALVEAAHA